MENSRLFEIEVLEPRFEFRTGNGFWATLWDGICWIAESAWDVVQALWETAGISLNYSTSSGNWAIGASFSGFFKALGTNWNETWVEYWPAE